MKKTLIIIISILVVATAAFAIYRFNFRKSIPTQGTTEEKVQAVFQQNDCYACHSSNPEAPFYANFPIIGKQVQEDMHRGYRFLDLSSIDLEHINEADLAKIEQAMLTGSMPMAKYRLIHWGTGFNKEEKSLIADWVMQVRANRFQTGLASAQFANSPFQPMVEVIATNPDKVKLGYQMFLDPRISLDGTVSCATCHPLDNGGVDGLRTSKGIADQLGGINAPSVYNAVFNHVQFWNGRANSLAAQAAGPPVNPIEMGNQTWDEIVARLQQDETLVAQFSAIYPEGLTEATVTDAIAEFEKTLITPNAPIDRYLRGDASALTESQIKGMDLFVAYNCATCHVGQAFGGQSFEYMGIMEDYHAARLVEHPEIIYNADDDGLKGFSGKDSDLHKYKVPILRNVALTAPYLHDGSAKTLDEAVISMLRFQTGSKYKPEDVTYIVDFLNALTGTHPLMTSTEVTQTVEP